MQSNHVRWIPKAGVSPDVVLERPVRRGRDGPGKQEARANGAGLLRELRGTADHRVIIMLRSAAMRSGSGGWVLNMPVKTWPAESGATMKSEDVAGETFIGIFLL